MECDFHVMRFFEESLQMCSVDSTDRESRYQSWQYRTAIT